jgi:hypothetical protein
MAIFLPHLQAPDLGGQVRLEFSDRGADLRIHLRAECYLLSEDRDVDPIAPVIG